jgi:riboflavin biosynthesis pyrimidine reductase
VRKLYPEAVENIDPAEVYADLPSVEGRPAVRLNMISSVDGATALDGVSGGLGSLADKRVFAVLRSLADVVLVAAGTVRAENYGPAALPIAVVTRTAQLDWQSRFFTEPKARPIVLTAEDAPAENVAHAREVADVIQAGMGGVDFQRALDELAVRGARHVLAEGGPTLNAQLAAAGLIDELCLTFSPQLAAGDSKRILNGPALPAPTGLWLRTVCEEEGYLFLRYRAGP